MRACFMAGYAWYESINPYQMLPSPEDWGWNVRNGSYIPNWTDLPDATIASRQLIKCSCDPEKGCQGRVVNVYPLDSCVLNFAGVKVNASEIDCNYKMCFSLGI